MAQWATFAGITGVVLVLLLVLSHLTQSAFSDADGSGDAAPDLPPAAANEGGAERPPASSAEPRAGARTRRPEEADPRRSVDTDAGAPDSGPADPAPAAEDAPPDGETDAPSDGESRRDAGADLEDGAASDAADERPAGDAVGPGFDADATGGRPRDIDPESLSTGELLANVALSQGLFACVLLGAVVYTGIPIAALGIELSAAYLGRGLALGAVAGLALYLANELASAAATRFGFDHDEELRGLLAPDSTRGWLVLLLAVLPLIAGFEELLFRAALIGAVATGFGVSPWPLAVVSSVAFALGHGMQGSVGVVVTGLLGFVLAAIFVVTGSFLVVVVAHYLINALEFVVHEGLEFDWADTLES